MPGYQMLKRAFIGGGEAQWRWNVAVDNRVQLRYFCRGGHFFGEKAQLLVDTTGKFL
ncbi:hypothetical protein [Desulfoluna spongiiphila]|uniref:hypothetical protein n=1 Tax=Desulfoluna spongiiphila TaxID=419481 RepID=UPI001586FBAE|nr:hypothetical protein [Desulfoluna spongiiphila]